MRCLDESNNYDGHYEEQKRQQRILVGKIEPIKFLKYVNRELPMFYNFCLDHGMGPMACRYKCDEMYNFIYILNNFG